MVTHPFLFFRILMVFSDVSIGLADTLMLDKGALRVRQECVNPASTYGVSTGMVRSMCSLSMVMTFL